MVWQLWPPTSIKDTGSKLHAKLKEAISQVQHYALQYCTIVVQQKYKQNTYFMEKRHMVLKWHSHRGKDVFILVVIGINMIVQY